MKTIVCIVMLFCLTALAVKAQEFDTMLVKDNAVLTVLKPKTEKIISTLEFSGVNPDIFSDEEIRQLEKGGQVIKESSKTNLPVSLLPVVKTKQFWTTKTYGKDKDSVKQTKPDIKVLGSEEENALFLSLFWLYLPVLCIFILSLMSVKIDKGRKKMFVFSISTFLAIVLAIIMGRFAGMFAGMLAGGIAGGIAGMLAGRFAGESARGLAGGIAGWLAGNFAGWFAGEFGSIGFSLNSQEFHIIWQYLGLYLVACLLAIGLRELMVLPRKGNDEKTVVV